MTSLHLLPLLALAALACSTHGNEEPFQPVSVADAARMRGTPGVVFVDANVPEVWAEHHLPGARHLGDRPIASVLPPGKDAPLVFYCSGPR
jgi:rhodanese-related sulfurtransferase